MKTNKAEIYKNAFRLFLQDNYEKVTVVKLEKAIGLSCRGIYHHTKDKLGLFKAVVDTYIFEPHKVENKFVFAEDISLRDFLQMSKDCTIQDVFHRFYSSFESTPRQPSYRM